LAAAQGLQGLQAAAAQGLQGLHFAAAQGLHGLQAAAQGLHLAAAQGLGFAPAQGLGLAAAQGLIFFFGAQSAKAGLALGPATRIAPPATTPAKTISGIIVVDSNILFLDCMFSFPPERGRLRPQIPGTGAAPCKTRLRLRSPNLAVRTPRCGIKATHFVVIRREDRARPS
jgi:hypothetical protein